jgi:two-component system chemotaxis response regulator CheY
MIQSACLPDGALDMPYRILYIEDESAIIELLQDVLEHPDIDLTSALDAEGGLKKLRETGYDMLILDVMMPDRSGWSVYEEIRADKKLKGLPIIMLTGQMHRYRIMKEFAQSPIDAYITKPFNVSDLREEIEKMLETPIWSGQTARQPKPEVADKPAKQEPSTHDANKKDKI